MAKLLQLLLLFTSLALAAPLTKDVTALSVAELDKRQASGYWMETIQRQGVAAYNPDASYKVFRNVKDYGAVGDGNADDSAAINKAIADGDRCGASGTGDCDSSTIQPAIVYFPAGKYKVSTSLIMLYYTAMIGDGTNPPSIVGSPDFDFKNLGLIDADPYIPGANGQGYYTNQNQFYRQVRNLVIDMTQMPDVGPAGQEVNGIHWQVAQASSMQNVRFEMKPFTAGSKQRGIMMENGSGMFMSDIIFNGGATGAFLGSQQFTTRNLTFNGCNTAIGLIWDWLWTFKSLDIQNCEVGINMTSLTVGNETVGSAIVMDSKISASNAGIITSYAQDNFPETGSTLLIHNVDFAGSQNAVSSGLTGSQILAGNVKVASWGQGNAYIPSGASPASSNTSSQAGKRAPQAEPAPQSTCSDMDPVTVTTTVSPLAAVASTSTAIISPLPATGPASGFTSPANQPSTSTSGIVVSNSTATSASVPSNGTASIQAVCTSQAPIPSKSRVMQQAMNAPPMPSVLLGSDGSVFERSKPQYIDVPATSFVSVKTFGAKGDGTTDDSDAVQAALDGVTADKILYFDHGAYVITKTINIPANIRIVGEIWPMMMISGAFFSDANNPQPAFRVGNPGDSGNVEISDMMFETKGPTPGAIMMEWNVQEASQGSVGMWDTHFRIGGSAGTELQQTTCDSRTSKVYRPECAAAFLAMHITQEASAYFENTWFWIADHDLDLSRGPPRLSTDTQISIFNGRGVLVESQGPVWLWGTSSEHSVLYNYQFSNAKNVFMGSIQTETAYMQPAPDALASGFTPMTAYNDPTFEGCTGNNCKMTWGLRVLDSSDIYMFGGGLYSFFQDYTQTCLGTDDCQLNMVDLQCSSNVFLYGLSEVAAVNMVTLDGQSAALLSDNINNFASTILLFQQ